MATEPLLELAGVNRVAADGSKLLCDVSLSIDAGERVALCGKSGSGKTLLLRSLAALDRVNDCLRWRGQRISAKDNPRFRSEVIYLHQTPALPEGTILAALQEPYEWAANSDRKFDRDGSIAMLQSLHLAGSILDKQTADLSGGEAALVAIVRALQLSPTMLLLDEPTAAMDQATSKSVETLAKDWAATGQRAYVWVTHDAEQACRVANRTIHLSNGSVVR